MKEVKKVAFLTAGGLAPCLSSSIGFLIDEYNRKCPNVEMIGYINGYMGLLKGDSIPVTPEVRKNALVLTKHGGSPIGNSRVKLTNVKDCVKRGLVNEGEDPLKVEKVQVFKSGYFARAAAPNRKDLKLIEKCARKAVECALKGESGVVGPDEKVSAKIRACEFPRIKGGKPFNVRKGSFRKMLTEIGQPIPRKKRTVK